MADEEECNCPAGGGAGWLATFADLMSLLMCFFVLLLSFAEMNVPKFKQASGSLKQAFGIQRVVVGDVIPKGNSAVTTEFSPGKPSLIQFDTLAQQFVINTPSIDDFEEKKKEAEKEAAEDKENELNQKLDEEVKSGKVEIEKDGKNVILRIKDQASFKSGSAAMQKDFVPSLLKIIDAVKGIKGQITIAGHTDNVPIKTDRYRSNWELSTGRAVTVAHALRSIGKIPDKRLEVRGYSDTKPIDTNETPGGRSKNRRVELVIGMDDDEVVNKLVESGTISQK